MYGTVMLGTLGSIVLVGIINPAAGMMMIATSVFATLIFFRIESLRYLPRPVYTPREANYSRANPYKDIVVNPIPQRIVSLRNPYRNLALS